MSTNITYVAPPPLGPIEQMLVDLEHRMAALEVIVGRWTGGELAAVPTPDLEVSAEEADDLARKFQAFRARARRAGESA
jgi:hypothetical protein